jgi:hypothetical protein
LLELGVDSFRIRPGITLKDRGRHKVTRVEYLVGERLRCHAFHQPRPVRFDEDEE